MRKLFRSGGPVVHRTTDSSGIFTTTPVLAIALVAGCYLLATAFDAQAEKELAAMADQSRVQAFEDGRRQGHDEMLAALHERGGAVAALPSNGCNNLGLVGNAREVRP